MNNKIPDILDLPDEIIEHILSYLDTQGLIKCTYVCKQFKKIISCPCKCLLCKILRKRVRIFSDNFIELMDGNFILRCIKNSKFYILIV